MNLPLSRTGAAGTEPAKIPPGFIPRGHGAGSGQSAHLWVEALADVDGLEVAFPRALDESARRLLNALGVRIVIDEAAARRQQGDKAVDRALAFKSKPRKTRAALSPETRERMRVAYFERPDTPPAPVGAERRGS